MRKAKRSVGVLLTTLALVIGALFSVNTNDVSASTVDMTVSNTSVSQNSIKGTAATQFDFDFAIPDGAKEGDTTVITLPDELTFTRSQTFNIYASDGTTVVATGVVDKDSKTLTMTYTDYVTRHNDVTGHIQIQVGVDPNTVKESKNVPAVINVNGNPVVISDKGIDYEVGTGDSDLDFWKYGTYDYDTNEITYHVNGNTAGATLNNVVIEDSLDSAGLEYVEGSFSIALVDWYKNDSNQWAGGNYTNVTSNYTVNLSSDKTSFSINLGTISRGYAIAYKVKPTYKLANGEIVKNTATVDADEMDETTAKSNLTYQEANGTASGYNYSITVKKTDESGNILPGATFSVTRKSTSEEVGTITIGSDGTGKLDGLLRDDYIITEVTAPDGYELAEPVTTTASNNTVEIVDKKLTPVKAQLAATKKLDGRALAGDDFEFTLTDQDGNALETVKNDKDGNIKFSELTFDKAGVYTYTISETNAGTTSNGVTYDANPVTATVTVTADASQNGQLSATVSYGNDDNTFENTYSVTPTSANLAVSKKLTGRELQAGEFEFVLKDEDGTELQKVTNAADGSVAFAAINYDKAGTYTYTIEETNGGQTVDGISYDDLKVTATVNVTDNGDGTLTAAVTYSDDTEFDNTYETTKATANLSVTKSLTGQDLKADEFEFTLTDQDGKEVETAKNDQDGNVKFSELTFDKAGTYIYTIAEKDNGLGGITYDTKTVTATVTVTDNGKGALEAAVTYSDETPFANTYSATAAEAQFEVTKALTGRDLTDGEFSFTLTDQDGNVVETVKNDKDGSVKFSKITFDKAGTYTYTISEVNDAQENVTYDDSEIKVTVTVKDNGEGKLVATVDYPEDKTFNNVYVPATGTTTNNRTPNKSNNNGKNGGFPNTGDSSSWLATVLGLILVVAGIAVAVFYRKSKKA